MAKKRIPKVPVAKSKASTTAKSQLPSASTTSSSLKHDECPPKLPLDGEVLPRYNFEMQSGRCVITTDFAAWRGYCTPRDMDHNIGDRSLEDDLEAGDAFGSRSTYDPSKPASVLSNFVDALEAELEKYKRWEQESMDRLACSVPDSEDEESPRLDRDGTSWFADRLFEGCFEKLVKLDKLLTPADQINVRDKKLLDETLTVDGVDVTIQLKALRMTELLHRKREIDYKTFADLHDAFEGVGQLATKYAGDSDEGKEMKQHFEDIRLEYARHAKFWRESASEAAAEAELCFEKFTQVEENATGGTNTVSDTIRKQSLETLRVDIATFNISLQASEEQPAASASKRSTKSKGKSKDRKRRSDRGKQESDSLKTSSASTPRPGRLHIREIVPSAPQSQSIEDKWLVVARSLPRSQFSRGRPGTLWGSSSYVRSFTDHFKNMRWCKAGDQYWRETVIGQNFARRPILEDPPFKPQPLVDPKWVDVSRGVQTCMDALRARRVDHVGTESMLGEQSSAASKSQARPLQEEDESGEADETDESDLWEVRSDAGDFTAPIYEVPARSFSCPDLHELSTARSEDHQA